VVISQGDVFWADLPPPIGSGPGYRRPVVIIQNDSFNRSLLRTVVCMVLTGNVGRVASPGNVLLPAASTGLPRDSVANVSQIVTFDKSLLDEHVGHLSDRYLELVLDGVDTLIGR